MKVKLRQEVVDEAERMLWNHFYSIFEHSETYREILSTDRTNKYLKKILTKSKAITSNTTAEELCNLAVAEFERSDRILRFKQSIYSLKLKEENLCQKMYERLASRIYQEIEAEYKLIGYAEKELKRAISKNIDLSKDFMDVYKRLKVLEYKNSNNLCIELTTLDRLNDEEFMYTQVIEIMKGRKE